METLTTPGNHSNPSKAAERGLLTGSGSVWIPKVVTWIQLRDGPMERKFFQQDLHAEGAGHLLGKIHQRRQWNVLFRRGP
jgi:hypothetical protein